MVTRAPIITSALQAAGWKDKEEEGKHMFTKTLVTRKFSVKDKEELRFYPTRKLTNKPATVLRRLAEDAGITESRVRDKGLDYSQHNKQREHQHICTSSSCP